MDPKIHPAITVSNIKNFIPVTLKMESSQYASWAELFKIHCRAYQVRSRSPFSKTTTFFPCRCYKDKEKDTSKPVVVKEVWNRLDCWWSWRSGLDLTEVGGIWTLRACKCLEYSFE
ncbi:hypothetical protein Hanom_Chr11g01059871 [Helianthus anomalus]